MSDTPRTDAVMAHEHAKYRIAYLAAQLERELIIQTNLVTYYKTLAEGKPVDQPVD